MKFRTTILAAIMLIVAGILIPTAFVVASVLEVAAREGLAEDLGRTTLVFEDLQGYRQSQLKSQTRVTSEEPRVKAVVATDEIEHATILDVAMELKAAMKSDLFIITDGEGTLLADTADPKASGHDLSGMGLVAESLSEGEASAIWTDDTGLFQMQSQRIAFGETVVGNLVVGYSISDDIAATVRRETGSSVVIQVDGETLASAHGDEESKDDVAAAVAGLDVTVEGTQEFEFGGERFVGIAQALPGYTGERDVRVVVYRSLDGALASSAAISSLLMKIGAAGFAAAIFIGLIIAWRLTRPLDGLVAFTKSIADGDLGARAGQDGPRELRVLGAAMNDMTEQLATSKAEIQEINAGLEKTVAHRTAEIREMLDNLEDGLFIADENGDLTGRVSPSCREIFGEDIEGKSLMPLLFKEGAVEDKAALAAHDMALGTSFGQPSFQWDINESHLLRRVSYRRPDGDMRVFDLRYAPMFDDADDMTRLMMVVNDVTEVLALEASIEEEQNKNKQRVAILMELLAKPRGLVLGFFDDNNVRFQQLAEDVEAWKREADARTLARMFRDLHTVKGNARSLGLSRISKHTHEVEDVVHELRALEANDPRAKVGSPEHAEGGEVLGAAIAGLEDLVDTYAVVADETLRGGDQGQGKENARRIRQRLEEMAGLGATSPTALRALGRLLEDEASEEVVSVDALFRQHEGLVSDVAGRLGKEVELVGAQGADLYLRPKEAGVLRDAMSHAIRNGLDHGLEDPAGRAAAGKCSKGRIWLEIRRASSGFSVEIRDDGQGVDSENLLHKAREKGIIGADDRPSTAELLEVLFHPGFSTKAEVTDISGRGVGLDAIRACLAKAAGSVELQSKPGIGTTLRITLPAKAVCYAELGGAIEQLNPGAKIAA